MNRERFDQLLAAYGADFRRWPAEARAEGEAFAAHGDEVADAIRAARALDGALDAGGASVAPSPALASRILAAAPKQRLRTDFDRRAGWALAACALLGVMLGFGGGMLAPVADSDDSYFSAAFAAPQMVSPGDEG